MQRPVDARRDPAVVTMRPVSTKRTPVCTWTLGKARFIPGTAAQWVVAGRPSRSPSRARMKAPLQTDMLSSFTAATFAPTPSPERCG